MHLCLAQIFQYLNYRKYLTFLRSKMQKLLVHIKKLYLNSVQSRTVKVSIYNACMQNVASFNLLQSKMLK